MSDERMTAELLMGHPVAEPAFLDRLEARTGQRWSQRPVGRPRKAPHEVLEYVLTPLF